MTEKKVSGNAPQKKVQIGNIQVAKWVEKKTDKNGNEFDSVSFTLQRAYKDKDGNWKNTQSMGISDLPKLVRCLQLSYDEAVGIKE